MNVKLSVIVPYSNQDHSRLPALDTMLNCLRVQDFMITDVNNNPTDKRNFEVIFVEQKTSDDYELVKNHLPHHFENGIISKHIVASHYGQFNKSWLMNIGAKNASASIFVYIDADMIFGKEYLYYTQLWRETYRPNPPKFFVGWDWIIKLPGRDEPVARMVRSTALTAGGSFWIDHDFYWEIGGMNENYFGYGGEDNDFWVRANYVFGHRNIKNVANAPYPMAHTYHHNAIPSPERFYHLNRTVQYPLQMIEKLRSKELGNMSGPTKIDVSELALKEAGIETGEKARGVV